MKPQPMGLQEWHDWITKVIERKIALLRARQTKFKLGEIARLTKLHG